MTNYDYISNFIFSPTLCSVQPGAAGLRVRAGSSQNHYLERRAATASGPGEAAASSVSGLTGPGGTTSAVATAAGDEAPVCAGGTASVAATAAGDEAHVRAGGTTSAVATAAGDDAQANAVLSARLPSVCGPMLRFCFAKLDTMQWRLASSFSILLRS